MWLQNNNYWQNAIRKLITARQIKTRKFMSSDREKLPRRVQINQLIAITEIHEILPNQKRSVQPLCDLLFFDSISRKKLQHYSKYETCTKWCFKLRNTTHKDMKRNLINTFLWDKDGINEELKNYSSPSPNYKYTRL